ncbi:MAG TPA: hypothetical protein VN872_06470 [Candidatus Acidoferrum sp.]|nr:hypothetical protein [Candidatus Acidoferrum sp.]
MRIGGKDRSFILRTNARAALNGRFERGGTREGANVIPGNIIFDIVLVEPANLTVAHITQAYQLRPSQAELAQQLLEKAQQRKLLGSKSIPHMALNVGPFFERLRYCQTTFCRVP